MPKKAIAQYMVILWSWLIFVFLVLFFLLLFGFSLKGCGHAALQELSGEATDKIVADIALLNFLRTPVESNGNLVSMADLISDYHLGNYEDEGLQELIRDTSMELFKDSEYCYKKPDISDWMINGACIFISEDPQEKIEGTGLKKERRFCTENFSPSLINIDSVEKIPLRESKFVYVHLYYSAVNSAGKKCPRYLT